MKEIWKKHKISIALISYAAVLFLFFFFAVNPLLKGIKSNSDEIQKKIIDREISQDRISKLPEMREGYAVYEQEKDSLNVLLSPENSVDFIKKVELLAEETQNKITLNIEENAAPAKNTKAGSAEKKDKDDIRSNLPSEKFIAMRLTLEGNYENLARFLYKLENLNYYVNVISLDLSKESFEKENPKTDRKSEPEIGEVLVSNLEIIVYTK